MPVFKCKMCGGTLDIASAETVGICEYCGTKQTLPKLDDGKKANLFDRANHFRRNNDFDKAMEIYEQILNEDTEDAESYWSVVLCRYGIEYVEDPASRKRVPTVNRVQFTSIFDDEDYKSAIKYADGYQKEIYEKEADAINEIQKGILAVSRNEEPFDVFICYKETDNNGRRTPDSVLANDLYHQLTEEGFKVFFAKITLENKLGTAYEPYIFAALNSARVMVVLGTKPDYFNAVWVKNEWSRYLALIKNGANKILIPAYRDMDPYELPEEFSHLQSQDMSKLGFTQDLIKCIRKIIFDSDVEKTVAVNEVLSGNVTALIDRGFLALEDGEWKTADAFFEQALNFDAKLAKAYLGKLMAELHVKTQDELINCSETFEDRKNYQKAVRFANAALKDTLTQYVNSVNQRNEQKKQEETYKKATELMAVKAYEKAADMFNTASEYKDSAVLYKECTEKAEEKRKDGIYDTAKNLMARNSAFKYDKAADLFESISGWRDSANLASECRVKSEDMKLKEETERLEKERRRELSEKQAEIKRKEEERHRNRKLKIKFIIAAVVLAAAAFTVVFYAVIVSAGKYNTAVALMNENKYAEAITAFEELNARKDSEHRIKECMYIMAVNNLNEGKFNEAVISLMKIYDFKDSKDLILKHYADTDFKNRISIGSLHTAGLKSDGSVIVAGRSKEQPDISEWHNIAAVAAGQWYTVGLKHDGTVAAVGDNSSGQSNVSEWKDITSVTAKYFHTIGLKSNGTVLTAGNNSNGQCDLTGWKDIVEISTSRLHTAGLKSDGTVLAAGDNRNGQCDVTDWKDIVSVSVSNSHTVGLKADGTVVAVGDNRNGRCDVVNWKDIVSVSASDSHTAGLKADGTVVAVGENYCGQCNVEDWQNIAAVFVGDNCTIGLKTDGSVLAVGENSYGQLNVTDWDLF